MKDLRSFLEKIRRNTPADIIDVRRTVTPKHETAAIITKLEQSFRFPIVVFHSVEGTPYPVVSNVCASMARLSMAMECTTGRTDVSRCFDARAANPIKPQLISCAPVQQRVMTGEQVDLTSLPQLIYHEDDSPNPYITAAIVVARDPETYKFNLSFHRLMIMDRNTAAIFIARGKHLDRIHRKFAYLGEPMPIAAFIGAHPMWSVGALYSGPIEVEEYDIIGGLQRAPLSLVQCVTNKLLVPAAAEFVLEGIVPQDKRIAEGPFGEFTGYSTGETNCPRFEVKAITSRNEPMFQDIVSGHAEHRLLPILPMEHQFLATAKAVVPTTAYVRLPVPLTAIVALEKKDDAEPPLIIKALLEADIYIKQVIVVDVDVDASDMRQVATAVALHVRPDRDVYIHPSLRGTELDPSCNSADGFTSKLGIDATLPLHNTRQITKNRVSQRLLDSINLSELIGRR